MEFVKIVLYFLGHLQLLLAASCTVGDTYSERNEENNIGGKWYLNVDIPATCSGRITRYRVRYYDDLNDGTYSVIVNIWKPTGTATNYEKDENSYHIGSITEDKRRRKRDSTREYFDLPSNSQVGVRKGSIIGVYLMSSNPLPVIGRGNGGACIYNGGNNSTMSINCTGNIQLNRIVHAESVITIVDCMMPDDVTNTNYILLDSDSDTQYGARAQYNCSTGYNATSGDGLITCQLNGQWTELSLVCELVNCGDPGIPQNGQSIGNVFTFGSSLEFQCNTGYELTGNTFTFCHANGEWNTSLPYCTLIDCGDPGIPDNGEAIGTDYTYNSTVMYSCDDGYVLNGSSSLICLTGQWNASLPNCTLIDCGYPGSPNNGEAIGTNYTYNSTVMYTCDDGYILNGSSSLICLTGQWNDTRPTCNPVNCSDPGTPPNTIKHGNNFTFQSVVTYTCEPIDANDDTFYSIVGNQSITCNADGQWSSPPPNCTHIDCNDPGIPDNGQRHGNDFSYNATVSFTCNNGYELSGYQMLTCEPEGKWDNKPPVCNIIYCNNPPVPDNATISMQGNSNFSFGSVVQFQCNVVGYELVGYENITCEADGNWTNPLPVCTLIVCSTPVLQNGSIIGSYQYNYTITFHCNDTYQLNGSSSAICQSNKSWSTEIPKCLKICNEPPILPNGYLVSNQSFTEGTIAQYQCDPGYQLHNISSTLTCTSSGQWIGYMPLCKALVSGSTNTGTIKPTTTTTTTTTETSITSIKPTISITGVSVTATTKPTFTVRISSTISSTPTTTNSSSPTSPSSAIIGSVVGVLIVVLVGIIMVILVVAFVWKRKERSGKLTINNDTATGPGGVTNPMLYSDLYGTSTATKVPVSSDVEVAISHEEAVQTLRAENFATDYEEPVQTLRKPTTSTNPSEYNAGSAYIQLENLEEGNEKRRELVVEEEYDDFQKPSRTLKIQNVIDNEYDNCDTQSLNDNLTLPPPIYLDTIDGQFDQPVYFTLEPNSEMVTLEDNEIEGGVSNSLYFTIEQNEKNEKTAEQNLPPVYFTLEANSKTPEVKPKLQNDKRKTMIYQQPSENEGELYGQIKQSSVPLINLNCIKVGSPIGSGHFGNVCKGEWTKQNGQIIEVAVKMLQDGATQQEKVRFLQEAAIMSQFKHSNVIKLYGVIKDQKAPMIIIEYMPKGDLYGFLQKMRPDPGQLVHADVPPLLLSFCRQICLGMTYLAGKAFVHRDLATRNILVSANNICKIIDFGMSRDLEDEENYYVSRKGAMIPVKWTAPEALNYRKYSTASDVWSYGCVLYEIWSIGHKPYENYNNIEALEMICSGDRLAPPPGCSRAIYETMISCWHPNPRDRPSFHDIMLNLLQNDQTIFDIPETDLSSHPQSGVLGATLKAGEMMYKDLQEIYKNTMESSL